MEENWSAFSPVAGEKLYHTWLNIAKKRTGQGEVATLVEPISSFFDDISSVLSSPFRRLFALTVPRSFAETVPAPADETPEDKAARTVLGDREIVGSGVVFQFPRAGLMTSDIQGLTHHLARPCAAYFVMMQKCVMMAQEAGYRWVDFGPTTEDPKIDVGARRVPCFSGYHTRSMLMKTMIKQGTEDFRRSQEARRAAAGDTSHKDMLLDKDCYQHYSLNAYGHDVRDYNEKSDREIEVEREEAHKKALKEERKRQRKAKKAAKKKAEAEAKAKAKEKEKAKGSDATAEP